MRKVFALVLAAFFACDFARAADAPDAARAARNQPAATTPATSRGNERGRPQAAATPAAQPASRGTAAQQKTETSTTAAPATQSRAAVTRKVAPATAATREAAGRAVASRAAATNVVSPPQPASRAAPPQGGGINTRVAPNTRATTARGTQSRSARPMMQAGATRTAATAARSAASGPTRARAAATQSVITSSTSAYGKCKNTFFSCMDEFCANKDASLRRCACSSRLHEFDADKATLESAQSKLTDFGERLVSVNMDKADAAAMSSATEGERAYNSKDKSASQKALDDIMKKINTSTAEAKDNQTLNTFNTATFETADMFDSVDSMMGSETATKEGDALYRAAYPTCKEMADEICEPGDFNVIQSAYKMAIEQDCNTLAKNYASLKTAAVDKTKEAGALLDMSRLTNQQDRNSADMLTCSKQMMSVFETSAVCGADLGKCLDWSGKYIDPMTGGAILTADLANLAKLLVRPAVGAKWSSVPQNQNMARFIDSKKTYIEPATKNCENIRDAAWTQFVDDALGRIKAAQIKKIEAMRQNCTTLVGQCKTTTEKTITDFDSRALSIFGVSMDTTVNKMCAEIQNACGALMAATIEDENEANGYSEGMKKVDLQKTYATILQNCKIVGQECVRVMCQTNESQFGLCFDTKSSQRNSILNTALNENTCYGDVAECVANTPAEDLTMIEAENPNDFASFANLAGGSNMSPREKISRNIWGSCDPNKSLTDEDNKIVMGTNSILSWFGGNTTDSCYSESCPADSYSVFVEWDGKKWSYSCQMNASSAYELCTITNSAGGISGCNANMTADCNSLGIVGVHRSTAGLLSGMIYKAIPELSYAATDPDKARFFPDIGGNYFTNCCSSGIKDDLGNCCETGATAESGIAIGTRANQGMNGTGNGVCDPTRQCCFNETQPANTGSKYCVPPGTAGAGWSHIATNGGTHLFCLGTLNSDAGNHYYGESDDAANANITTTCMGAFVAVDEAGVYRTRLSATGTERFLNYFYDNSNNGGDVDKQLHHRLFVYLAAGNGPSWFSDADGFYNIMGNPAATQETIIGHRVAYCASGFWISRNNNLFGCCGAADAPTGAPGKCDTYYRAD